MHVLLYTARTLLSFAIFFFFFFFGCVRCIVWLPLPDTSDAVLLADTWLDGLGKRSKCQLTELLLLLRLVWIRPRRSIGS